MQKRPKHIKQGTGAWTDKDNDRTRSEGDTQTKYTDTDYQ